MGRERTGSFDRSGGKLRIRIPITTMRNDREVTVRVWASPETDLTDEEASALAREMTEHYRGRVVSVEDVRAVLRGAAKVQTVAAFVGRVYLPSRAEHDSHKRQVQWWNLHVLPVIGAVDVRMLDADHLRRLVDELDQKVEDRRSKFGWKTAQNVWGLVTRFCSDLASHKDRRIRLRSKNPAAGVRGPDRGDRAVKQWLYPTELHKLLSSPAIPLARRRRWALLVYLYARAGELAALEWDRIDLAHGLVTIDRAQDLQTGKLGMTKTHDVRVFRIEPHLVPLLEAMQAEGAGFTATAKGATELRHDLKAAGVIREELFVRRGTSVPITQHDLRATGITYLAMRGDTDDEVRERAGHTDFKTTLLYLRRGRRLVSAAMGEPFGPLPPALLGSGDGRVRRIKSSNLSSPPGEHSRTELFSARFLCEEEDSNLHALSGTGT